MEKSKTEAQQEYCALQNVPFFAPRDGRCWGCGKDVYQDLTVEEAGRRHIVDCPRCHKSFVE